MKTVCLTLCCMLAAVGFVFAGGDLVLAQPTPFDAFVTNTLQPLILSLLGVVLTVGITYLTALLKRKFGIEISAATADRLRGIAADAVTAVEERAAATIQSKAGAYIGASKHAEAVNYILARAPSLTQAEADNLVHSALTKIKGLGATAQLGA